MEREIAGKEDRFVEAMDLHREKIDKIDSLILKLLNLRLSSAQKIGEIKGRIGKSVTDRRREERVLERLSRLNQGPMSGQGLREIYQAVFQEACRVQGNPNPPADGRPNVGPCTEIYAVMGNPVSHSLSPVMHNRAFAHIRHDAIYLAFQVTEIGPAMTAMKNLGIRGASITIPHKEAVIGHLDELDPMARQIGAVNTVINEKGKLMGYNSDGIAAARSLAEAIPVQGERAVLIGAGGAARAIGFALAAQGALVSILARSREKGRRLAEDLGGEFLPLAGTRKLDCRILVNTTPVGMHPAEDASPIPAEFLQRMMVVMDIVYNPLQTRLLRDAEAAGCKTVDGLSMFVYQGAFQFELWTGRKAPVDVMRDAVRNALAECNWRSRERPNTPVAQNESC